MSSEIDTDPLHSIHAAQAAMADRVSRGGWRYDLIYSALFGVLVAGWSFPIPVALGVEAVTLIGLGILAWVWANHTGVWISGIKPPEARWIAILLGVSIGALLLANLIIARGDLSVPAGLKACMPWITGIAAFGLALRGSRLWRRVYRREMGLRP